MGAQQQQEAEAALQDLVAAIARLERAWDDSLNAGYPAYLPSFDDVHHDVIDWLHAVKSAKVEVL